MRYSQGFLPKRLRTLDTKRALNIVFTSLQILVDQASGALFAYKFHAFVFKTKYSILSYSFLVGFVPSFAWDILVVLTLQFLLRIAIPSRFSVTPTVRHGRIFSSLNAPTSGYTVPWKLALRITTLFTLAVLSIVSWLASVTAIGIYQARSRSFYSYCHNHT